LSEFFQQLINGLALGSIYALIALGYTMVYGVLRFINFAHGDVFMVGAFCGLYLAPQVRPGGAAVVHALVCRVGHPD
jgi:branched-chain amino acid transport system permease protein